MEQAKYRHLLQFHPHCPCGKLALYQRQTSSISAKTGIEIALLPTNQANGSALIGNKAVITLVLGREQEGKRRTALRPFSLLMDVTFP